MLSASGIFKLLLPRDDHNRNALSSSFFLFMDAINDDYTQTRATAAAAVDGQVFIYFFCCSGGLAYSYGAVDSP